MFKKLLLMVYFVSSALLHGSALGKRPSLNKISMSSVLGRLTKEMDTESKIRLYHTLGKADKIQGMRKTLQFLYSEMFVVIEEYKDHWGGAILCIISGVYKDGIALRDEGRNEEANDLIESIKEMQELLFSCLQSTINDAMTSPRGSSDLIKREKSKKNSAPLKKETEVDE